VWFLWLFQAKFVTVKLLFFTGATVTLLTEKFQMKQELNCKNGEDFMQVYSLKESAHIVDETWVYRLY